ncbi:MULTISPECIES: ATP-binding protein [unclassified Psychrobacter]|uniref:ATP-binding protein n=1 Tax=unclassified Psychrobacter TaxID=196806 RepID=UPI0018F434DC|nr:MULTISPECIES: ATP-binding protein [unclassified Psychrobacter]
MSNRNTRQVNLSDDHVKRVSNATPVQAIEELVWNSLDADATRVSIRIESNDMGNQSITIEDNGEGITEEQANAYLIYIGNSWKAAKSETKSGRPIHGQKGAGRFKSFSLGRIVDWKSVYQGKNDFYQLDITLNSDNANKFDISNPSVSKIKQSQSVITISELNKKVAGYNFDDIKTKLTQTFAIHLYTFPEIEILVNGYPINPEEAIASIKDYTLELDGLNGQHIVTIVEWSDIKSKKILLCKDNGTVLQEQKPEPYKVRSLDYSFSAYLSSDYITQLNNESSIDLVELTADGKSLLEACYQKINDHFKDKKDKERLERLQGWKDSGIYPFQDNSDPGVIEIAKREIFDIIASKVEDNLPKFSKANHKTKKFTFKLLSQALEENPQAMQSIMTEVLNLNTEEQDEFAKLLEKTSLSHIIKSAKIVADRLDFLDSLHTLVFDHKNSLLERDQLHKILENEAWVFDEHFALSASEKRLEDVLKIHLNELGKRCEDDRNVLINDERQGRLDLMLSKAIEVRPGQKDYLVVELKRPKKKIDSPVIAQIMGYAQAVSDDERFNKSDCKWKFLAISNELDSIAYRYANNANSPKGCVYSSPDGGIEVYVMTWSEVITNARVRLQFYQEQLRYEADTESSIAYLHKVHNEFIPQEMKKQA